LPPSLPSVPSWLPSAGTPPPLPLPPSIPEFHSELNEEAYGHHEEFQPGELAPAVPSIPSDAPELEAQHEANGASDSTNVDEETVSNSRKSGEVGNNTTEHFGNESINENGFATIEL
jgi:hypothetical protein